MAQHIPKRKCKHCQTYFLPDPRCVKRQRYCSQPPCRQASKMASQRRWHAKPENREYFKGPPHVARVQAWRQAHPGYWHRPSTRTSPALQEDCTPQPEQNQELESPVTSPALQDHFFTQPTVFVGLLAHLTGSALQDDIVHTARRLQQLGHDILGTFPTQHGGFPHGQTSYLPTPTPPPATPVQLGGSASRP